MYYIYEYKYIIYVLIENIFPSPAKCFNTENRIWLLSKYSNVLFNFKKQKVFSFCGSSSVLSN